MGIIKIRHRGAGIGNHEQRSSNTFMLKEPVQEDRLLLGKDLGDDSDDSEFADVGCELAIVGNQMCNIPYELYDLSDLKEIVSLESWNSCLTEEERFYLAAYLPDMDQETFVLTIKELLNGDNVFFGSPLGKLFCGLKGGFYSLQVSRFKEGLQFLQKRSYYHSLRSYHESMAQKFVDMRRAWSNCQPSTSIEERIRIWNNNKDHKPVLLVDLNAVPDDEDILNKGENMVSTVPLSRKTTYISEGVTPHTPTIDLNSVAANTRKKAKGVLKLRPIAMRSTLNHNMQPLASDSWEPCRRPPKGVLKIKPKLDLLDKIERSKAIPFSLEHTSDGLLGVHSSRSSPPHYSSKWHEENVGQKLPFLHQTVANVNTYRSREQSVLIKDRQREEFLNMAVGPFNNSQSYQRKTKMLMGNRLYTAADIQEGAIPLKNKQRPSTLADDTCGNEKHHNGENILQTLDQSQQSRMPSASFADSYLFASHNHQRLMTPVHPTISGAIARISTIGTDKHRMLAQFTDHKEPRYRDHCDGGLSTSSDSMVVSGIERDHMFPITYKRKKAHLKLSTSESLKQTSMETNSGSILPSKTDCHLIDKPKTVKIKVKGWNDCNSQHKQRLLNGLQHDSPST